MCRGRPTTAEASNLITFGRIVEEGEHSLQNYIDGTLKTKGKDGFFINPGKPSKSNTLSYNQKKHEKEAKEKARSALADFIKSNNIKLTKQQQTFLNSIINGQ